MSVLCRIAMDRGLQLLHVVLESVQRCFVSLGVAEDSKGLHTSRETGMPITSFGFVKTMWLQVLKPRKANNH